ncbi:YceD family protein [Natranaerobius trueperi]|uniref:Metal-binding protein n=1 Tax=Natranaerobius trueperi TaxID=759412 RepID=A0A226BZ30_9FIRM|nr:DUF177 domain-containing protein [Natranaerobius trueperi]OWZ84185.1 hypothetical protein CDO51_04760 [Natranaerobius trueperi]
MKVELNSLKSAPDQAKSFEVELSPPEELKEQVAPVHVKFTAKFTGDGVLVTGDLSTTYHDECHRCLKPAEKQIELDFQEEFLQKEKFYDQDKVQDDANTNKKEVVLEEEELSVDYFSGNELDLTDFLRQLLILAIPPKIVCKDSCPGLCPYCGKDLSKEKCNCGQEEVDPRLVKLRELKKDL